MIPEEQIDRFVAALDRVARLDALWVFGSEALGRATASSDVDLAALFASSVSPLALASAREELVEIVGRPVDLVDLERASPILAMQVVRHGKLVRQPSPPHRVRFVAALPGRYEDVAILRRPAEKLLLARLANGRA